jgi:hypothetical protein
VIDVRSDNDFSLARFKPARYSAVSGEEGGIADQDQMFPRVSVPVRITRASGVEIDFVAAIETSLEIAILKVGGMLPFYSEQMSEGDRTVRPDFRLDHKQPSRQRERYPELPPSKRYRIRPDESGGPPLFAPFLKVEGYWPYFPQSLPSLAAAHHHLWLEQS